MRPELTAGYNYSKKLFFVGLAIVFLLQIFWVSRRQSPTNDEPKHLATGWWFLKTRDCCIGIDNTPFTGFYAAPIALSDDDRGVTITPTSPLPEFLMQLNQPERALLRARMMNLFFAFILIFFAARLAADLYGAEAPYIVLPLIAFDPNLIAHFALVSPDAQCTCGIVASAYFLHLFFSRPNLTKAVAAGLMIGLSLLCKFTAYALLPSIPLIFFLYRKQLPLRRYFILLAALFLAALIIVWEGYGFHMEARFPFVSFPGWYLGFKSAGGFVTKGLRSYLNGEVGTHGWHYIPEAFLLKSPLPSLIFWCIAAITLLRSSLKAIDRQQCLPIFFAGVFFLCGILSPLNLEIRHILPVFPLLSIASGSLFPHLKKSWESNKKLASSAFLLIIWLIIGTFRIHPYDVAYFNEAAGGLLKVQQLGEQHATFWRNSSVPSL